ncbi:hypothetical protein F4803DRAFT_510756 [Xylaria telfairii]|nr:hypothetical protein F4803DRAFT_510756 [Xylaria telfairii]
MGHGLSIERCSLWSNGLSVRLHFLNHYTGHENLREFSFYGLLFATTIIVYRVYIDRYGLYLDVGEKSEVGKTDKSVPKNTDEPLPGLHYKHLPFNGGIVAIYRAFAWIFCIEEEVSSKWEYITKAEVPSHSGSSIGKPRRALAMPLNIKIRRYSI